MCRPIFSNESVRPVGDLAELDLPTGSPGVVPSGWFYPTTAYEGGLASGGAAGTAGAGIRRGRGRGERPVFAEKAVRGVTAKTREDGEELLPQPLLIPLRQETTQYLLEEASRALRQLKHDATKGSGVVTVGVGESSRGCAA